MQEYTYEKSPSAKPAMQTEENAEKKYTAIHANGHPYHRSEPKVGRNEKCPCGSGKKYKLCCLV
jgi:uncharacterized protein YecA (UPF0149 family)